MPNDENINPNSGFSIIDNSADKPRLQKYESNKQRKPEVSDKKSVFNKIDINSISVRKFNLDVCEDQENSNFEKFLDYKRVCLPIFPKDILESFNCLDINSSCGKYSQYSKSNPQFEMADLSAQKQNYAQEMQSS